MKPVDNSTSIQGIYSALLTKQTVSAKDAAKKDTVEISNTSKSFDKLNKLLNLGRPGRLDIEGLNPKEKDEFLKMLSELLQRGIVGYEILEVNGKPEKHFIVNEIGDKRIQGAKLYKKHRYGLKE